MNRNYKVFDDVKVTGQVIRENLGRVFEARPFAYANVRNLVIFDDYGPMVIRSIYYDEDRKIAAYSRLLEKQENIEKITKKFVYMYSSNAVGVTQKSRIELSNLYLTDLEYDR